MNIRIFWVRAMKCMCAQTRPRFILSSKRVFGGMEFEPMLTPREKSSLLENFPRGGSNPRRCGQRAQTLPTSYSSTLPEAQRMVEPMTLHQAGLQTQYTTHWAVPIPRFPVSYRLVDLVVKVSASRAEGPGFESCLRRDFFGVESYQWLKNWHTSGYPARRLAL